MSEMREIRRQRLSRLTDLRPANGLEIGPLADPLFVGGEGRIRYVDVVDQQGLRDHYRDDPSVVCDDIPVIDFTLTTEHGVVSLAEAVKGGAPFDCVVACHVIEHVPDLIGWLGDISEILTDDGLLMLVVPDRRCCFDFYRQQTSVGQMLQASDNNEVTPSVRAVFDHFRDACAVSAADSWRGRYPEVLQRARIHSLEQACAQAERARAHEYVDCHVWTFTPRDFVEQLAELGQMGLSSLEISAILPTPFDALEFYSVLRRIPRNLSASEKRSRIKASRVAALSVVEAADEPPVGAEVGLAMSEVQLESQLKEVHARLTEVSSELMAVKSSKRWIAGGIAVWPARQVRKLSGRRSSSPSSP